MFQQTCYGTASLVASVAVEATEEEEYNGCDGANPRRRPLLSLADEILLRSIGAMTAGAAATAVGSTETATMSMLAIDVVAVDWAGGIGGRHWQQRHNGGR